MLRLYARRPARSGGARRSGRRAISWLSSPTSPVKRPNYDFVAAMQAQDPKGRIAFLRPTDISAEMLGFMDKMLGSSPDSPGDQEEAHCIPFWTMLYTASWDSTTSTKSMARIKMDFGFSVSAVAQSHWAHGIVLTGDAWTLYQERLRAVYDPMPAVDETGKIPLRDWFRGHEIPAERVAKFATGYPVLRDEMLTQPLAKALGRAAEAPPEGDDKEPSEEGAAKESAAEEGAAKQGAAKKDEKWTVNLDERIRAFAIPNYRVVYRTETAFGDLFRDGTFSQSNPMGSDHYFILSKQAPRVPRGDPSEGSPGLFPFIANTNRETFLGQTPETDLETISQFGIAEAPSDNIAFARDVYAATRRAKLDWNDPNIFSSDLHGPQPNLFQVMYVLLIVSSKDHLADQSRHAAYRSFNFPARVPPKAFEPPTQAAAKPLSSKANTAKKTLAPTRPAAKPPTILPDPQQFYQRLEIKPDVSFIQSAHDKAVTEKLDQARRVSKYMLYPQTGNEGMIDGWEKYSKQFDEAYEALNTLAKRKAYSQTKVDGK